MSSPIDALCNSMAQLEPEAMFSAMWEIRNRIMDTWTTAAERVICKHFPSAKCIHPSVVACDEYGNYVDGMEVEMHNHEPSLFLPHIAHLYMAELTPKQKARVKALVQGCDGAEPMPTERAELAVLSEAYGLSLDSFCVFLQAVSDLADRGVEHNEYSVYLRLPIGEPLAA